MFALVGLPGAIVSLILLVVGIFRQNVKLSIVGAVLSLGFCYTASAYGLTFGARYFEFEYSAFYLWLTFLVLAGGNLLSAWAVWKRAYLVSAVSIVPFVVGMLFLVSIAMGQFV